MLLTGLPTVPLQAQTSSQDFSPEAIRFFQDNIQPLFENNCRACHNDQKSSGGLSVESRVALLAGGNRGPAVLPGRSQESLLLGVVRHQGQLKMPPTGKLPEEAIAALTHWVDLGAPWGESRPADVPRTVSEHWSVQAIQRAPVPEVRNAALVRNGIDRFILARL